MNKKSVSKRTQQMSLHHLRKYQKIVNNEINGIPWEETMELEIKEKLKAKEERKKEKEEKIKLAAEKQKEQEEKTKM